MRRTVNEETGKGHYLNPTILVIFGATGDLVAKKIAPALFHLFKKGELPKRFKVVGFARREFSDREFQAYIEELLKSHKDFSRQAKNIKNFCKSFSYSRGNFETREDYFNLLAGLSQIDGKWGMCSNKLFYLAVPPELYANILKNLSASKLTEPCGGDLGWSRVIVEKPFGSDLKTARKMEEMLSSILKEEQIYRIDHYLAKEMIQNILAFRFSNNLFEGVWGADLIESIYIRLHETIGVEKRGGFYDSVGALRDVGQNHLLQILALLTMDHPRELNPGAIRIARAKSLQALAAPRISEIKDSIRAQYRGYREIKGVNPRSKTETFFRVKARLNSPRWQGVNIILEAGKRFAHDLTEAEIVLKHPSPCLCPKGSERHLKNTITIQLEPKEAIIIGFWSKRPGFKMELEERFLDFELRDAEKRPQYTEEYEKLLLDCIFGDQTLFVGSREIEEMWRFTDPIIEGWRRGLSPLKTYKPDTNEILEEVIRADGKIKFKAKDTDKGIGFIGLGKMGLGMASRLIGKGYKVLGFDKDENLRGRAEANGVKSVGSIADLAKSLKPPRLIWLMVPHAAVGEVVKELSKNLKKGDTVIDGGNSFYKDSISRAALLAKNGVSFLDVGVSGGPEGARSGACLMIGGERWDYERWEGLFRDLSAEGGYGYLGTHGAGHFVKMVHNGIEYGMMQSIAEGFTVLRTAKYKFDLEKIADLFNRRSVIESRLISWLKDSYEKYGRELKEISGKVARGGEAKWTVETAKELGVTVKIIEDSLRFREMSEKNSSYTGKVLSALRNQFGGHEVKSKK